MMQPKPRKISMVAIDGGWCSRFDAMGSPCEVLCETDDDALAWKLTSLAANEAWRIEDKFSRYVRGNIVDRLNTAHGAVVTVDEETAGLLDFAAIACALSEGRFDITSGVLRKVWQFDGSDRVPASEDVEHCLQRVGWHRCTWVRPKFRMPVGMEIDFGGIGKEYAVDRCAQLIRETDGCPALVNFGGDLAVTVPPLRRQAWIVGVEGEVLDSPERIVELREGALATSGDARRFVMCNGVRYGHILNPITGWPVEAAPHSVTVAAETCTQAGMLSTLAILEGHNAASFLDEQEVTYWCRH